MRILVIGGTSFIGPPVVHLLADMGDHDIRLFHRGQTQAELPESVQHILGDHKQLLSFKETFLAFSPDVVLDMILSNAEEAQLLVDTFQGTGTRIIAISSQDVYRAYGIALGLEDGELEALPITEQSALRSSLYPYRTQAASPQDGHYRYDKILVEQIIMQDPTENGTVLRLPAVYGPGDGQYRFHAYLGLKRMLDRRPYLLMDDAYANWRWTHGYVENVAAAIAAAVLNRQSAGRIYNVGAEETPTMLEFTKCIGEQIGWHGEILVLPKEQLPVSLQFPLNTSQLLVVDSHLMRVELNCREHVCWEESLSRTIRWEQQHPPVNITPKYQNLSYELEDALLQQLGLKK